MFPTSCRGGTEAPGAVRESGGDGGSDVGEERRQGFGVQDWTDGSRYEGEFMNGFKHGKGKYTWSNGEFYEGSFYKDYRHGDGVYYWPTGHKFIGKFYLNRKEGYGQQVFPDGASFQGLYRSDQRFGPGVVTYPDGCQDVGLWLGERLLKLCTHVEEGFSLRNLPEYAAYMDPPDTRTHTQHHLFPSSGLQTNTNTELKVDIDRDLLSDEDFILPPGMESYSTDGDHLPIPPGQRRELDQHFFGELWESDSYQGYKRDPLSTLPLQERMQAHIHKHRLQAENVDWDVSAILSLSREGFGPKGPLEVSSEMLIHHCSRGEEQAVSQILQTHSVHPDVADSQGHTALIAATVNCHSNVIQLLLDEGADIDQLNCEGMSALAVCHVLYYPYQSLHTALTEPPPQIPVLRPPSSCENRTETPELLNDRLQTTDTNFRDQNNQSQLSDQTAVELTEQDSLPQSKVSSDAELNTRSSFGLSEPVTPTDTEHPREEEEERREKEVGNKSCKDTERSRKKDKKHEGRQRKFEKTSRNGEEREDAMSRQSEEDVEDVRSREGGQSEDLSCVDRSIQVLDGHIALGSVQWKQVKQDKNKEVSLKQTFDSACSLSSFNIQVTEDVVQRSAEALSRTGFPQDADTEGIVRKMAAMKIERRVRLKTLKLLLERGADPNISRVPMPVLFLAIMASDPEAVKKLLLCGARTDICLPPEKKGLYPLHMAAALPGPAGPKITEMLLHTITDPDAQACDQDDIYEPDRVNKPVSCSETRHLREGGRTALHVACQRDGDYLNSSKVVALLLSHSARTDLLWSGHSPLSLAVASGNDMAVEQLLKGGADPNLLLGHMVGSALCTVSNINYHLGDNRIKLLDMLAKAGGDILMPIMVGDTVGTAVDYAHSSFLQDLRISHTPFHALNMRERETFKARRQLLGKMGDLLRQTACQKERENLERELTENSTSLTSTDGASGSRIQKHRKPAFKFCYHCGRSLSVKLTACSRCHKVYYCSRNCKLKAWDERHKEECIRPSAPPEKNFVVKSRRSPHPLAAMLKSKRPLSIKAKTQRASRQQCATETIIVTEVKVKENYSCN